ncbi:MAG: RDD family protein, partial [Deltaproteobacteria bacterium]
MTSRRYGGFWRRLFAFLFDAVILYFVSLILFMISLLALGLKDDMMGSVLSSLGDSAHGIGLFALLYIAASLLAGMIYFTGFHGMAGRTPGKIIFGLRVIQASGDPITPGIAFLRWVSYLISGPLFCLGFLWVAFDGRKQGWHDKIAATLVI